ncbi:actin depolymerizing protein [Dothidotthia symphoricarpi CBS 119687]|uniref:Actin depolymerizing protein n=1 Tax=Dothidotthia symphoricarpi CBS 119687 TaxID=1392245 RepID=A0A6A6AEW0_9PLEO|nr:actin depolymerizing protein [Dothidotthia symphoricarpi CBS 119687]KAF2129484.1 actin depolymerizing protein [Dothidotthia symphoricarpi CBS 119687]
MLFSPTPLPLTNHFTTFPEKPQRKSSLFSMASESRLYTFSAETQTKLRKFRLGTSRAKDPQAVIYEIDKKTLEIRPVDDEVYTDVQSLADDLPEHAPRYVLLSYPLTLDSGRLSVPYVMLYYLPVTCNNEVKMLYASAKELMRNTAEVNRIIEIDAAEDIEDIEEKLKET